MIVLVPSSDFREFTEWLSDAHLIASIESCEKVLATLRVLRTNSCGGFPSSMLSHPSVSAWSGFESALSVYCTMSVAELVHRGGAMRVTPYSLTTFMRSPGWYKDQDLFADGRDANLPDWWGRDEIHLSHRRALMYWDPVHYRQFGWRVVPRLDIVWPSQNDQI